MSRQTDTRTGDLFAAPMAPREVPGALNFDLQLRHLLSQCLKESPKSRYEIAARMSEFLGDEVSKHQLCHISLPSKSHAKHMQ
jgi:hypothetical protein